MKEMRQQNAPYVTTGAYYIPAPGFPAFALFGTVTRDFAHIHTINTVLQ